MITKKANTVKELIKHLNKQLKSFDFKPLLKKNAKDIILKALNRYFECVSCSVNQSYSAGFDVNHSGQYCIFLYLLSNEFFLKGLTSTANAIYYLNKVLNGVDFFYRNELPKHFGLEHPIGTIVGRATIRDHLYLYQNCTIGVSIKKEPRLGDYVVLCAGSQILGDCVIGDFVVVSSGTTLINRNIPDYSIVFSDGTIKTYSQTERNKLLNIIRVLTDFKID